jgi:hypothetical protein
MTPKPHQTSSGCTLYDHALLIAYATGVAAIAGSVHLMISKLCLKDHHSQTIIDWPPEVHRKITSNPNYTTCTAASRPKHTQLLHGRAATPPAQEFTSFPFWVVQQHSIATMKPLSPPIQYLCTLPH